MDRSLRMRTLAVASFLALCVAYLLPTFVPDGSMPSWYFFDKKIKLGLDLQGGGRFVYRVDLDKAIEDKGTEVRRDVEAKLSEKGIDAKISSSRAVRGSLTIKVTDPSKVKEVEALVLSEHKGEVTKIACRGEGVDNAVCVRIAGGFADEIRKSAVTQAVATVKKRVNGSGVAEPNVYRQDQKIIVELPGIQKDKLEELKELIVKAAKLEFKVVDNDNKFMLGVWNKVRADAVAKDQGITTETDSWTNEKTGDPFSDYYLKAYDRDVATPLAEAQKRGCVRSDQAVRGDTVMCNVTGRKVIEDYLAKLAETDPTMVVPDDSQFGFEIIYPQVEGRGDKRPYWRTYLLERAVRLTGTSISRAQVRYDSNTLRPEVIVNFNRFGGRMFGEMTGGNVGKKMAIILDDQIESAPIIQTKIGGGVTTITMGGADVESQERDANQLVNVLRTGSLPAPLQAEQAAELGPTLGRDAVSKAQLSFILGTILVVVMMVGIYRWSGLIAVSGIVINLIIQLAAMAFFGATLTLPGIAALVLTVGMDVDGNILIYERIRDELNLGKSVRGAVDIGFQRAFSTILDGHMTTAAAGWVLLQYGTGPIHGFAVLLLVGIGTTLFVNTFVTRILFDWYIHNKKGELATISI